MCAFLVASEPWEMSRLGFRLPGALDDQLVTTYLEGAIARSLAVCRAHVDVNQTQVECRVLELTIGEMPCIAEIVRVRHYRLHVRAWSGQSSKAGFGACISRSGLCCLILRSASARARLLVGGGGVVGPLSLSLSTLANRSGSDGSWAGVRNLCCAIRF